MPRVDLPRASSCVRGDLCVFGLRFCEFAIRSPHAASDHSISPALLAPRREYPRFYLLMGVASARVVTAEGLAEISITPFGVANIGRAAHTPWQPRRGQVSKSVLKAQRNGKQVTGLRR